MKMCWESLAGKERLNTMCNLGEGIREMALEEGAGKRTREGAGKREGTWHY